MKKNKIKNVMQDLDRLKNLRWGETKKTLKILDEVYNYLIETGPYELDFKTEYTDELLEVVKANCIYSKFNEFQFDYWFTLAGEELAVGDTIYIKEGAFDHMLETIKGIKKETNEYLKEKKEKKLKKEAEELAKKIKKYQEK